MLTISLEDVRFYAGPGVYPEETMVQNTFLVSMAVRIDAPEKIDHLSQTVDYEQLYAIIREEMNKPATLLEAVASSCVKNTKAQFPKAKSIEITIRKLNPPMGGEIASSTITLKKNYDEA